MSQLRIFEAQQYSGVKRVDKIYMNMIEPRKYPLSPSDQQYAFQLQRAFVIMSEQTVNHNKAIKILRNVEECSRWDAVRILSDAEDLYGMIRKLKKETQSILMYDRCTRMMEKCFEMGNQEGARKWMGLAIKVGKLDKLELETLNVEDISLPNTFNYTDDASTLIEDLDYDEEE